MYVFLSSYNPNGILTQASGLAVSRCENGESLAEVEGKHFIEFAPDEETRKSLRTTFNDLLVKGGQTSRTWEDERGEWWASRLVRIPGGTAIIALASKLSGPPPERLSKREIKIIRLMAADTPSEEIREALGISSQTYSTATKALRKKVGVRTNGGLVRFAMLMGYCDE